jgi:hypothetical protein
VTGLTRCRTVRHSGILKTFYKEKRIHTPQHIHTASDRLVYNTTCSFTVLEVERETPCMPILFEVERDTPCTSILLALKRDRYTLHFNTAGVERDTPCTSIRLVVKRIHPACPLGYNNTKLF